VGVSIRAAGIPRTSSMAVMRVVGVTERLPGSAGHAERWPDLGHGAGREWGAHRPDAVLDPR